MPQGGAVLVIFNRKTNTLEQTQYKYSLQDVDEPNLYREIYSYDEIPKCTFNHRRVPMFPADEIWLTDTTFGMGSNPGLLIQLARSSAFLICCTG
jgi:citrate (Re)-synthase